MTECIVNRKKPENVHVTVCHHTHEVERVVERCRWERRYWVKTEQGRDGERNDRTGKNEVGNRLSKR